MTGSRRSAASASSVSCISAHDVVIDIVEVGLGPELLAQIDRRQRLDRDLGRQRDVAEHVADIEAPGQRQRDRQHLEAKQPVEGQQPGQALAAGEEQRRLLAADRDDRDDRHILLERQADEALAAVEVDAVALPARPVDLVVAARVDEQGGAGLERLAGVVRARRRRCRTCATTRARASTGRGCGRAGRRRARRRSRC